MPFRLPMALERAFATRLLALPPSALHHLVGAPRHSPDGLTLDLQLQTLLWLIDKLKVPNLVGGAVDEARRNLDSIGAHARRAARARRRGLRAQRRGGGRPPAGAVYVPDSVRGAAPGLVYFHGGGWVVGSIESHDRVCRALASRAGLVVASVDYRLAPEHRFPAAAEDAVAATRWILANATSLEMDPARIAVGGDSAGGNLTAVVCQALRKDERRPAFQLLVYPGTDMTRSLPSHQMFKDSFFLSKAAADCTWACTWATRLERDVRASPLFATDLSGLPPALVITCGFNPLRDEGRRTPTRCGRPGSRSSRCASRGRCTAC